jgi:hypothetical protein
LQRVNLTNEVLKVQAICLDTNITEAAMEAINVLAAKQAIQSSLLAVHQRA